MLDQEPPFPEPMLPEPGAVLAAVMQHVGDRQRELQVAEAARIVALLEAYRVTMEDAEIAGEPTSRDRYVAKGFLVAAGTVLRMSQRGAAHLLDTASAVRGSLPRSWAVFLAGECSWRLLDLTNQQADGLEGEPRRRFDEAAALLLSRLSAPDLKQRLHRLRERLDPGTAPKRAARAARSRHTTIQPLPDGQAAWTLIGPAHVLAAIEDGVHQQAVALHGLAGEERCFGALRFDVAADILLQGLGRDAGPDAGEPARKAVTPTVLVTIPALTLLGLGDECPNLAGYGPIDLETAKRLAGDAGCWTRIFTDPVTGDLVGIDAEARRIPRALKSWLTVRDETCRAPGCGRPANRCDIDHVRRYEHGGPTSPDNLVCLCRGHHQVKDDGCWTVALLPDGRMEWRSRWGTVRTTEPAVRVRV